MSSNKSCTHLLSDYVNILKTNRWHKNMTGLKIVIDEVAYKCTSSDF